VQVLYDEGVANHIGPKPCAGVREDAGLLVRCFGPRAAMPISRISRCTDFPPHNRNNRLRAYIPAKTLGGTAVGIASTPRLAIVVGGPIKPYGSSHRQLSLGERLVGSGVVIVPLKALRQGGIQTSAVPPFLSFSQTSQA
jgi:hypothetical protein